MGTNSAVPSRVRRTGAAGEFRLDGTAFGASEVVRLRATAPEEAATPHGFDVVYWPAKGEWSAPAVSR